MKKIIISVLAVLMLLSCSCGNLNESGVPAGMKRLSNDTDEFYMYIPEAWVEDKSMDIRAAYCNDTQYGNDFANVSLIVFRGESSLQSFWEKNKESLGTTFSDIEYEIEDEVTTVAGCEAIRYVYKATVSTNRYKYMQTAVYFNGYVYLFTYTALEEYYGEHYGDADKDVNRILDTFSFKQ